MIVDNTHCIYSTCSRAWISTALSNASLADRTVTAEDTLGSAGDVGIPHVVLGTGTGGLSVDYHTLSIGSARIRIARIFW